MSDIIFARGLRKQYKATVALRGLDWSVPTGSVTALVGPNGAGKTTTVKLLLGLTRRDGGELRVFDNDPSSSAIDIRRRIGFVPEDKTGFDGLRVDEVARYTASFYPTWNATHFDSLLADWRVDPRSGMSTLSKGNRTKVFVALALSHEAELLVLDEPTDGLDPVAQENLLRRLVKAAADGRTVVIVTHRLAEVESVADRVALINDGRVLLDGDLEDLRQRWKLVRARTTRSLDVIRALPGVRRATRTGDLTLVVTDDAERVADSLSENGNGVNVASMNLHELYLAMNGSDL